MTLPILSIPVLHGKIYLLFEILAQSDYQRYINRTEGPLKKQTRQFRNNSMPSCLTCC